MCERIGAGHNDQVKIKLEKPLFLITSRFQWSSCILNFRAWFPSRALLEFCPIPSLATSKLFSKPHQKFFRNLLNYHKQFKNFKENTIILKKFSKSSTFSKFEVNLQNLGNLKFGINLRTLCEPQPWAKPRQIYGHRHEAIPVENFGTLPQPRRVKMLVRARASIYAHKKERYSNTHWKGLGVETEEKKPPCTVQRSDNFLYHVHRLAGTALDCLRLETRWKLRL